MFYQSCDKESNYIYLHKAEVQGQTYSNAVAPVCLSDCLELDSQIHWESLPMCFWMQPADQGG